MLRNLEGKRILITGASSGIGKATAELFSKHGSDIGVHYNSNMAGAIQVRDKIRAQKVKTELFQGNLLDFKVRATLVEEFVNIFGGIDILINNAGAYFNYKHFSELDERDWDEPFDLYVKSPFTLMRDAFQDMKKRGWGRIVNISTVGIKFGGSHNMNYVCAKAALEAMTTGFAREGTNHNILVNNVRCGLIDTPMRTKIPEYGEERFRAREAMVPLGRAGKPIDVARTIVHLCSNSGDFITGQTIAVSGGE